MKNKFLKYSFILALTLGGFSSCISEDDYEIPEYVEEIIVTEIFEEDFETSAYGSGANEVPIALDGWVNTNIGTGNRVWIGKLFSSNIFAEFSSFYSAAGQTDQVWLITPEVELGSSSYFLSFTTQARFHNSDNLTVLVSDDYDGTVEGISSATWVELDAFISNLENNQFMSSGNISLDDYTDSTVRIGFKYVGSKSANQTTTFQLDNIKIFEF